MKFIFSSLLVYLAFFAEAQTITYHRFWVQFTDKNDNPYSLDFPEDFLSEKSLERRSKQGISLNESDLPLTSSYLDSIINTGALILNKSKWFNAVTIETQDSLVLQKISGLSFVKSIEPVAAIITIDTLVIDTMIIEKRSGIKSLQHDGKKNHYGNSFRQINMLKGDYLHELGFKGNGITIAVLDAGFNLVDQLQAFDSLRINNKILGTWDFVDGNENVFKSSGHGTAVLSIMGGNIPGQLIGTAPEANYWLLRTEDASTEFRIEECNWIAGAEFADSVGADIINSSLGYSTFSDSAMDYSYLDLNGNSALITKGADMASGKGILVVTSAGNQGATPWKYISAPADADSVLTVGAVDSAGSYASFSSTGPTADGRIKPNVMTMGKQATFANLEGGVSNGNGTSFSSPVMAGLAACLWQTHPDKSNMEILQYIEQSGDHYQNPNDSLGFGIPDLQKAHFKMLEEMGSLYVRKNLPMLYPNPFHKGLSLMLFAEKEDNYIVEVFDGLGKRVFYEDRYIRESRFSNFDLSALNAIPNGMYFLRIHSSRETHILKVMKI